MQVKTFDGTLNESIKLFKNVIDEVNSQAKETENEIHSSFEKLRTNLNEREVQLLNEVESIRYENY